MAHYPFHFAFPVRDLPSTRAFYGGSRFVIEPMARYRGRPEEQATMFLLNPGNALELKAYRDPSAVDHR